MIKEYIYYSPIKKTVLEFIVKFIDKNQFSPTYLEIAKGVNQLIKKKILPKLELLRFVKI